MSASHMLQYPRLGWQVSTGISGSFQPESVATFDWNTQVSFGGQTKEFHVDLDPNQLVAFNVSMSQVLSAIANSNANVGANYLELGVQSYNVRGLGLFKDAEDIANV